MTPKEQFKHWRREARLGWFEAAYLLNQTERKVKRWESQRHPDRIPPALAIATLESAAKGLIHSAHWNWKQHGVDPRTWRPVRFPDSADWLRSSMTLRLENGPTALAEGGSIHYGV